MEELEEHSKYFFCDNIDDDVEQGFSTYFFAVPSYIQNDQKTRGRFYQHFMLCFDRGF